ncbi:TetR/AcrR family transcriptional regulator [Pseudonocardia acidicola]|uniref:TetR/AcrR family transcriptional regulator n=1 Tax=Pseudonocardia acidicola TaxID=2724939 RepID=A0ABX1S8E5_9PSEU|nr:TetR/AcrR family transcriptional regulator [Pseudonocardia acidicola]NMH97824.1 TetR/AcrR family transcriptional regulator [Pseudonocardia acidicola]
MPSSAAVRLRSRADKFEDRRRELADAALLTLADLGYARTSLRTIADNTSFSHGLLHYYFADKIDLITYCVRRYKDACVQRYEGLVAEASTPDELAAACGNGLATTLADAPLMHRLWYDLRSQSLFEEAFRDDVAEIDGRLQDMIWRLVRAYADLTGTQPTCSPSAAYAMFDGLFQQALQRHLAGSETALDDLRDGSRDLLPRLFV